MRWRLLVCAVAAALPLIGGADEPQPVPDSQFESALKMVRRQKGEWPWAEIPWRIHFKDAQKVAAEEGKPILIVQCAQGSVCGGL